MTTTLTPGAETAHREELDRLEILRAYKKHFAGDGTMNRSPFTERVVRYDADVETGDIPEIHGQVRGAIQEAIRELHKGQSSRVAIFAGQAGMGKTHLLNHFRSAARQQALGYVFVSNPSNYWKIEEFEECLLTWLVAALVRPSLRGPNLLSAKIEALAFQALEQILDQPGKLREYLGGRRAGWLARLLAKLGRDQHAQFRQACKDRDARIFRRLDFRRFADFVCERFLHNKENALHCFILKVLLRYLFPQDRDKVCAWLIGQKVHAAFLRQMGGAAGAQPQPEADAAPWPDDRQIEDHLLNTLGVADRLDRNYKFIETLKILISLFSPDLNRHQPPDPSGHAGRVFFFAFDQAEGRNELFANEADWFKFFAKLSELYNALPNVFIAFTMTTDLRNQLYSRMERQFRDRIQRDQKFVLERVADEDVLAIYQRRLELWRGDHLSQLSPLLRQPRFAYLPFRQEELIEKAHQKTLRQLLETFDGDFRKYLDGVVVGGDARLEYLVALNELRELEKQAKNEFEYTEAHLQKVQALLARAGGELAAAFGLSLSEVQPCQTDEGYPALRVELRKLAPDERWVRVVLARLPHNFKVKAESYLGLLQNKVMKKNFLWLVRPLRLSEDYESRRPGQVFTRQLEVALESRLAALLTLLDKRDRLPQEPGLSAQERAKFSKEASHILVEEFKLAYLGEMFQHAAQALENQSEGKSHDAE